MIVSALLAAHIYYFTISSGSINALIDQCPMTILIDVVLIRWHRDTRDQSHWFFQSILDCASWAWFVAATGSFMVKTMVSSQTATTILRVQWTVNHWRKPTSPVAWTGEFPVRTTQLCLIKKDFGAMLLSAILLMDFPRLKPERIVLRFLRNVSLPRLSRISPMLRRAFTIMPLSSLSIFRTALWHPMSSYRIKSELHSRRTTTQYKGSNESCSLGRSASVASSNI